MRRNNWCFLRSAATLTTYHSKYNTQVTQPPHIQVAKSSQRHLSQLAMQPSPTSNQPSPTGRLRRFYDREGPHFGFTNFSDHSVKYEGRTYRTGEHLFQAMKVCTCHYNFSVGNAQSMFQWMHSSLASRTTSPDKSVLARRRVRR